MQPQMMLGGGQGQMNPMGGGGVGGGGGGGGGPVGQPGNNSNVLQSLIHVRLHKCFLLINF